MKIIIQAIIYIIISIASQAQKPDTAYRQHIYSDTTINFSYVVIMDSSNKNVIARWTPQGVSVYDTMGTIMYLMKELYQTSEIRQGYYRLYEYVKALAEPLSGNSIPTFIESKHIIAMYQYLKGILKIE